MKDVLNELEKHTFELVLEDSFAVMLLDGFNVMEYLYTPKNSEMTSILSALEPIRTFLIEPQRNAFKDSNIVIDGRDVGSVVFKDADVKFFIKVDTETKIKRRIKQLSSNKELSKEELEKLKNDMKIEIIERDERDEHRALSPTVPTKDAYIIDNSNDGIETVINKMISILKEKGVI
ncbi:MAG: (d)CMP kinase [Bdellovibrionota bacterium]